MAAQRLKSLESYARGITLDISRNLELLAQEKVSLATSTETQQASKLSTEEFKLQQKTRYPTQGKGGESSSAYPGGKRGRPKEMERKAKASRRDCGKEKKKRKKSRVELVEAEATKISRKDDRKGGVQR